MAHSDRRSKLDWSRWRVLVRGSGYSGYSELCTNLIGHIAYIS